jgi:ABC-type multidrug transport system fused ATPase/permease subunit
MLAQPARALGTFNTVAQEGLSALKRIYSQLNITPQVKSMNAAQDLKLRKDVSPSILFKDVCFAYNSKSLALININFFIKPGSKVAVVGQSGAGKSTIVNLIGRFYDPLSGQIIIDKQDIKKVNILSLRKQIALVSQETIIYNKSFIDNIRFGNLEANEKQIIQAAKNAGIHKFIDTSPEGYNTILGEGGNKLSGGQKQRISIARAILKNAPILLLDEATSSLDAETENEINASLEKLTKNKTTITIAHKLSTVVNADQIIVFDKGKVVAAGSHLELLNKSVLYRKLYKLNTFN